MQRGTVFNIQKFSLQDGPGIRTTVFLKGCPLRCIWCHNPEGVSGQREIIYVEDRCLVCGQCREVCPVSEAVPGTGPLPARNEACILCGECTETCPAEARQMAGREMTVREVMDEVLKDRIFYDDSMGGITFSGGEPLMQPQFLRAILEACQAVGLHTAVDTCGYARQDILLAMAPLTDLFLFDLKIMDSSRHQEYTGVSNDLILQNLKVLDQVHDQIWIRVPLIPGINDSRADLETLARFAASIRAVRRVTVLPYHKSGLQKRLRLGHNNALASLEPPAAETVESAVGVFRAFDLEVRAGG